MGYPVTAPLRQSRRADALPHFAQRGGHRVAAGLRDRLSAVVMPYAAAPVAPRSVASKSIELLADGKRAAPWLPAVIGR